MSFQLIVGLGNPGPQYAKTRHNAGQWFVEGLAKYYRSSLVFENKFHGEHAVIQIDGQKLHLLIPQTFMNLSGRAVRAIAQFYKISPEEIVIVHDEIDLPPGSVKIKKGGGHGGHNGLRNIIQELGDEKFFRLRIGVGHPGEKSAVVNYVLHPPAVAELALIDNAVQKAFAIFPLLVRGEVEKAMHQLHTNQ